MNIYEFQLNEKFISEFGGEFNSLVIIAPSEQEAINLSCYIDENGIQRYYQTGVVGYGNIKEKYTIREIGKSNESTSRFVTGSYVPEC
ncbi:MAG: hypothetical protein [Caudoviricetes sp.]|nr:MAG: hypothetical protein [Caudoviricetes sp.]